MILLIDNYDSFSYNLYQLIGANTNEDIKVIRNDELSVTDILDMNISHLIISPGPGKPKDAGVCEELILSIKGKVPILGICLGHQAICEAFGGKIGHAKTIMHGKSSVIDIDNKSDIFKDIDNNIKVARYHSLSADKGYLPKEINVIATSEDGEVMAVKHNKYKIYGLQFHPESILTDEGNKMINNFLNEKEN